MKCRCATYEENKDGNMNKDLTWKIRKQHCRYIQGFQMQQPISTLVKASL